MKVIPVYQAEMDAWKVDFRAVGKLWEMFKELDGRGFNVELTIRELDSSLVITSHEYEDFVLRANHRQWIVVGHKDDIRVLDEKDYQAGFRTAGQWVKGGEK